MGRPPGAIILSTNMFQINMVSHELAWLYICGFDDVGLDTSFDAG